MPRLRPSDAFREELAGHLERRGLVSRVILDAALAEQRVTGEPLGSILVRNGFVAKADLMEARTTHENALITPEPVDHTPIPVADLERHTIIVTGVTESEVHVSTPHDEGVAARVAAEHYPDKIVRHAAFVPDHFEGFIDRIRRASGTGEDADGLERLIGRAVEAGASDIHLTPRPRSFSVFFRVDGVRRFEREGDPESGRIMIARIKDRAGMDIAERRVPQEGRFTIDHRGRPIDLRVATVPAVDGEIVIVRVLDADRVQPDLDGLGLTHVAEWRRAVDRRDGLCLVCGPTGSGKTTTLTATVREMDRLGKAIYTIEDPVEYRVAHTGQVAVNPAAELDFARVVRSFLRADPDVIVIGEIRDEETARTAIRAADTGRLVLSTLHTGSIVGAIARLRHLGVAPADIKGGLRGVLAQSLIRTTCRACGGVGCEVCGDTGYAGRTAISECAVFDTPDALVRAARGARVWPSMREDAAAKFHAGLTTGAELARVFGAEVDPPGRAGPPATVPPSPAGGGAP